MSREERQARDEAMAGTRRADPGPPAKRARDADPDR